jgi:tetratricopeptide (TPR) repeat protein
VFAFLAQTSYGQNYTSQAYSLYQAKDYEGAVVWIDSAIVSNERFNSQTWQLRGIIYRKLESPENENYREIAIESFVQARNVDSAGDHKKKIDDYLYNTIIRYYNDAVGHLNAGKLELSENEYTLYKGKYKKYIDPNHDFNGADIEYYNALGSEYLRLVGQLSGEEKDKKIAKGVHFFQLVLELDPSQFKPNFNVGIMYYNQGADLIMNMDPFTPIEEIPLIESEAQEGFNKALPFLLKALELSPERIDIVEAVTGCYYGLQDNDNYMKYQTILDKSNLPSLLEKHQKDPEDSDVLMELIRIYSTTIIDSAAEQKYTLILNKLEE